MGWCPWKGASQSLMARWWSPTLTTHYNFVPEKCQGHFVSVPKKEQKRTVKPWRLLWNRTVFPLALLIKPLNTLLPEFPCYCSWGMVVCMSGRYVSSLVTKRFLGCGFIELFQAELGCCMLLVLWYWYRAGFLSTSAHVGGGKLFKFKSFKNFWKYTYFRKYSCLAHNTSSLPPSFHSFKGFWFLSSFPTENIMLFAERIMYQRCCCVQSLQGPRLADGAFAFDIHSLSVHLVLYSRA